MNNLLSDLERCRNQTCACTGCNKAGLSPINPVQGEERCWRCDKVFCAACKESRVRHSCMELRSVSRIQPEGPNHPFCVWCCKDGFTELPGIDTYDRSAIVDVSDTDGMPQVPVDGKGKEEEQDDDDEGTKSKAKVPAVIDGHRLTKAERKAMKKATKAMEMAAKLEKAKKRMNQVRTRQEKNRCN